MMTDKTTTHDKQGAVGVQVEPIVISESSSYQIEYQPVRHDYWYRDQFFTLQNTKQDAEDLISSIDSDTRRFVRYRVIEIKTVRLLAHI